MVDDSERKERVIHMRVEPSLDSELKERAGRLGVSVSNLVRNILQHAFGLAEDVIKDSAQVARSARGDSDPFARSARGETEPAHSSSASTGRAGRGDTSRDTADEPPARPPRTIGWQRFTLGLNALCERCNAILPKGSEAGLTVLDGPGPRPIHCLPCVEELTHGPAQRRAPAADTADVSGTDAEKPDAAS